MNKIFLIGNLTKDPEKSMTQTEKVICKFDIAVTDGYGETMTTDYFHITVFGKRAESCADYLLKGAKVAVVGKLKVNNYERKDGVKAVAVNIIADEVQFLTPKNRPTAETRQVTMEEINNEDLPF